MFKALDAAPMSINFKNVAQNIAEAAASTLHGFGREQRKQRHHQGRHSAPARAPAPKGSAETAAAAAKHLADDHIQQSHASLLKAMNPSLDQRPARRKVAGMAAHGAWALTEVGAAP